MKFEELEIEVKSLVAQNKLKEAIDQLSDFYKDDSDVDEIIIQSSSYHSIIEKERKGTADTSEVELALNRLRSNILGLLRTKKEDNVYEIHLEKTIHKNQLDQYPTPKRYFTGREKEQVAFKKAIDTGTNLIAIDGPGGIGKTQYVAKCIEEYISPEKVIWFDCKLESHFDTLVTLAGYPELLEGDKKTNRVKFSAFKDKLQENEYFLFLDNFQEVNNKPIFKEFLVFIQEYLKKGSVIAISRDNINDKNLRPKRIHIEGFKKEKLEYARKLIDHSYEGLIDISDEDLSTLCDELQGYPLAIDFAILLLSEGEKHTDIISKIVTAEDAEEISTRLLNAIFDRPDATQEEKDFLLQFSVFTGSVHEDVVPEIISEETVKAAAKKLRKKNLISYVNETYDMHALVRAFCYDRLDNKEDLHKKVSEYFLNQRSEDLDPALEERIFYHLLRSNQLEQIEKEIEENGRKFIIQGQLELVKELIEKLKALDIENATFNIFYGDISEIQGDWEEALKYYELAKEQEENIKVKAQGMIKYGEILYRKGETKEALTYFQEAKEFIEKIDSLEKEKARVINDIGIISNHYGDTEKAIYEYNEALKIRIKINDNEGIATSYSNLASIFEIKGELDKALIFYQKSLNIHKDINNKQGMAGSFIRIGNIFETKGDLDEALIFYQKSLNISSNFGFKQGIASSLSSIAMNCNTKGDISEALDLNKQSLEIVKEIGDKKSEGNTLGNIGNVYYSRRDYIKALGFYKKGLHIFEKIGDKQGMATIIDNIGNVEHSQSSYENALENHKKSLKIKEEIGNRKGIAASLGNIGSVYWTLKDFDLSIEYTEKSLEIDREVGNKKGVATSLFNLGAAFFGQKQNYYKAIEYHFNALVIFNEIGAKGDYKKSINIISNLKNDIGLSKFKSLANQVLDTLNDETKKHIPIQELLNEPIRKEKKVGRNEPCPCGSGKKYKRCHGK